MTTEQFIEYVQIRLLAAEPTLLPVPEATRITEIIETYRSRPGLRVKVHDGTEFFISATKA